MALYIKVKDGTVEVRQLSGALVYSLGLEEACERLQIENHNEVIRTNERLEAEVRTLRAALANTQTNGETAITITEAAMQVIDPNYHAHMLAIRPLVLFDIFEKVIRNDQTGAIRAVRRMLACDSITAKVFVEHMSSRLDEGRGVYDLSVAQMEEIKSLLNFGLNLARIVAVRQTREVTGTGLADAVYFVDHIQDFIDQLRDAIRRNEDQ